MDKDIGVSHDLFRLGATEVVIIRAVQALGNHNAYGAAVQRYIRDVSNRVISLGQIATTLERLQAKELLTSHTSAPESIRGGRAKRIFTLEERGVKALEYAVTSHAMIFGHPSSKEKGTRHGTTDEAAEAC
jgi:PadR family transcriptional regulator, regulatory protein PadR